MATLYIRNFPDDLYERLKKTAKERGISLSALVIELVEKALRLEEDEKRRTESLRH